MPEERLVTGIHPLSSHDESGLDVTTQENEQNLFLDRLDDNTKTRARLSIEAAGLIFDSRPTVLTDTKAPPSDKSRIATTLAAQY